MSKPKSIIIPIIDDNGVSGEDFVEIFPDELPVSDVKEKDLSLINVLRSELAPLRVWRACAVEYHRQGFHHEFHSILSEVVEALKNQSIDEIYKLKENYLEGITEIFLSLAAKSLSEMAYSNGRTTPDRTSDSAKRVVEYLKLSDEKLRINEYTWLIKGFYEIIQGDIKRAEDHFRYVYDRAVKEQKNPKRKFSFGYYVGMGIVNYTRQKYELAVDFFAKAITHNVNCDSSVRVAFASCCFKLGQYDRAKASLKKTLSLDATNPNALVLHALLSHVDANKERSKRTIHRTEAFEYSALVNAMDPKNATALNLLANHYFHTWNSTPYSHSIKGEGNNRCCALLGKDQVAMHQSLAKEILEGDQLRFRSGSTIYFIIAVTKMGAQHSQLAWDLTGLAYPFAPTVRPDTFVVLKLNKPLNSADHKRVLADSSRPQGGADRLCVEVRQLGRVEKLAKEAIVHASLAAIRAESNYILGKVAHTKNILTHAFEYYKRSVKEVPDMVLSLLHLGQIHLSRKEFPLALEMFNRVLAKVPDDRDTQAYMILTKAILHNEEANFDKLREIAPGFQFEIDLWLIQGGLRQKRSNDHMGALKCYLHAKDCIEMQGLVMPSAILSNIAVLYHSHGNLEKALTFGKLALSTYHQQVKPSTGQNSQSSLSRNNVVFKHADFEEVFYAWSKGKTVMVTRSGSEGNTFVQSKGVPDGEGKVAETESAVETKGETEAEAEADIDFTTLLSVGDEVLIESVRHTVESVQAQSFTCYSPVQLSVVYPRKHIFAIKTKVLFDNFNDSTITFSYNLARLLEDAGSSRSAMELYVGLLKIHPSYIECYLRLSIISCELANYDDATMWLSRALAVSEEDPDINICLADLYNRSNLLDDAKRVYEKILKDSRNKHDPRSMTCLGNYNYSLYCKGESREVAQSNLNNSYKFFYQVLDKDRRNVYAANGLGIVCAEKGEVDAAKDIISKAQEANMPLSQDVNMNLAHIYLMQERYLDAERLYQVTSNSVKAVGSSTGDTTRYLMECASYAQFKQQNRDDDAVYSLLRALHLQPNNIQNWYNLGVVAESFAMGNYTNKPEAEIRVATNFLQFAKDIFGYLSSLDIDKRKSPFDRRTAIVFERKCTDNIEVFGEHLQLAIDEKKRSMEVQRKYEDEHSFRLRLKQEEKEKAIEVLENEKKEKKITAGLREKKLQELQEQWVNQPIKIVKAPKAPKDPSTAKPRGKRATKKKVADDELGDDFYDDGDGGEADSQSDGSEGLKGTLDGKIDFGSEDEGDDGDDGEGNDRGGGSGGKKSSLNDSLIDTDLFGDDSDEGGGGGGGGGKRKAASGSASEAPVKRLKKREGLVDADSDEEMGEEEEGGGVGGGEAYTGGGEVEDGPEKSSGKARKGRVIQDSDDDE